MRYTMRHFKGTDTSQRSWESGRSLMKYQMKVLHVSILRQKRDFTRLWSCFLTINSFLRKSGKSIIPGTRRLMLMLGSSIRKGWGLRLPSLLLRMATSTYSKYYTNMEHKSRTSSVESEATKTQSLYTLLPNRAMQWL